MKKGKFIVREKDCISKIELPGGMYIIISVKRAMLIDNRKGKEKIIKNEVVGMSMDTTLPESEARKFSIWFEKELNGNYDKVYDVLEKYAELKNLNVAKEN